jgi:hypothetical protein
VPLFLGLDVPTTYEWAPLPHAAPSRDCCACLLDGGFNLCHDCQSTCRNACDVAPDDCVIYPTLLPVLPFQPTPAPTT